VSLQSDQFFALTLRSKGNFLHSIVTPVGVSIPFVESFVQKNDPRIQHTKALWDTGATHSVITKGAALSLGLKPIDKVKVSHATGESIENVFLVNLYLPNGLVIPNQRVTECADNVGGFGVIIGMNIISGGDFSISHQSGETIFSYRYPSKQKEVDFTKKEQPSSTKGTYNPNVGDQPCPCKSGKVLKNCCGKAKS
jgi:hypothetical protein